MDSIEILAVVEQDGEVHLTGLPYKQGQEVEISIRIPAEPGHGTPLSARALLDSGLIGLWADRDDIGRSDDYARRLREQAQHRRR